MTTTRVSRHPAILLHSAVEKRWTSRLKMRNAWESGMESSCECIRAGAVLQSPCAAMSRFGLDSRS